MTDHVFNRADLELQCEKVFESRCPPIELICDMDGSQCGCEQRFQWAFAKKYYVQDPVVFFLRAAALFYMDSYVFEDGSCFPGYSQLTSDDLNCAAFQSIKGDLLLGNFQPLQDATIVYMREIMASFDNPIMLDLRGKLLRGLEIRNEWNDIRLLWETEQYWGYIEWSTSG